MSKRISSKLPLRDALLKLSLDEYLREYCKKARYGGFEIIKAPAQDMVTIRVVRPGMVIGKGGEGIKQLTEILKNEFGLLNPQITVVDVENPDLDPQIMAERIASALERGLHFRRVGFWALNRIMQAGALGAEIVISGKLLSKKARFEKYSAGHLPKRGDPAEKLVRVGTARAEVKLGTIGIKVKILPPEAKTPDAFYIALMKGELPKIEEVKKEAEGGESAHS